MTKGFKVYTKRVANELCKQGFKMLGTVINNEKPWLYVYLFEDSPEFRAALEAATKRGEPHEEF